MSIRTSKAEWTGDLKTGKGKLSLGSGVYEGPYNFISRFENGKETNPEELIGAAHAGCFSMFLSALLSKDGFIPAKIETIAKVHLGEGPKVTLIELDMTAEVPNIEVAAFMVYAENAKMNCPISVALSAVETKLTAKLIN